MPLRHPERLPPRPEGRTLWQLLPRNSARRVLFLLLALGGVLFLRSTGGGGFRGLVDAMAPPKPDAARAAPPPPAPGEPAVYRLRVGPAPASPSPRTAGGPDAGRP
jgi:hypothetical protein